MFLKTLEGIPKCLNECKNLNVDVSINNISDLEGCQDLKYVRTFNANGCQLTSLKGIPKASSFNLSIVSNKSIIRDMSELKTVELMVFDTGNTKFDSFEYFPKHIKRLHCTIGKSGQGYISLSRLHELVHDTKQVEYVGTVDFRKTDQNRSMILAYLV
jgi:hypothetical protein